jgi:hypothetical protein
MAKAHGVTAACVPVPPTTPLTPLCRAQADAGAARALHAGGRRAALCAGHGSCHAQRSLRPATVEMQGGGGHAHLRRWWWWGPGGRGGRRCRCAAAAAVAAPTARPHKARWRAASCGEWPLSSLPPPAAHVGTGTRRASPCPAGAAREARCAERAPARCRSPPPTCACLPARPSRRHCQRPVSPPALPRRGCHCGRGAAAAAAAECQRREPSRGMYKVFRAPARGTCAPRRRRTHK